MKKIIIYTPNKEKSWGVQDILYKYVGEHFTCEVKTNLSEIKKYFNEYKDEQSLVGFIFPLNETALINEANETPLSVGFCEGLEHPEDFETAAYTDLNVKAAYNESNILKAALYIISRFADNDKDLQEKILKIINENFYLKNRKLPDISGVTFIQQVMGLLF